MSAYYNEIEPYAAQWLRNLIAAGHIAPGDVDERSIVEVQPEDLRGYTQCHFFAGIGVWSHALRRAGWSDDRPVWTGSCPCQPFSVAGAQRGTEDERHLWPELFRLIRECRPAVVFGEQVAGGAGLAWLDHVCADLEDNGYAVGAADLCAAGAGAPHIRQRLFFVANGERCPCTAFCYGGHPGCVNGMADAGQTGRGKLRAHNDEIAEVERQPSSIDGAHDAGRGTLGDMGHAASSRCERRPIAEGTTERRIPVESLGGRAINGFWSDAEWIWCRDGKYRPTQPGLFPLAHGATSRVGRLRAYGNAIVAPLAEQFIRAARGAMSD